ncbi:hypothetical protein [Aggregatilinea lenta]|uniref:hypothetical protein n=1 Tax=Aggregatilinea lenta TaxID=913108 RepID=UPI000E5B6960|nr:hypothetical protein [Aggregatilinea lenta]
MQPSTLPGSPEPPTHRVSPAILLGAAIPIQWSLLVPMLRHTSTGGAILDRYSTRYAAVLAASALVLLAWIALFAARRSVLPRLAAIPPSVHLVTVALMGAGAAALFFTSFEGIVQQVVGVNVALAGLLLIRTLPDGPARPQRWPLLLAGLCALLLAVVLIGVLADRRFSPDEANWADMATSPYIADGLYTRTWLQEPIAIIPGVGWSPAAYGWLLTHVSFDVMVGRAWNFAFYVLAFIGIAAVTARLYSWRAGLVSACYAALSQSFIPVLDYRPDHQLPAAGMLLLFGAIVARQSAIPARRAAWHVATGLLAVLALELHAGAIVYIAALSLFYAGEWALRSARARRLADLRPLLWFGLGGLLGSAIYYVFNIDPVGGIDAYLTHLVDNRGERLLDNAYLVWRSLFDRTLAWAALAYLLWRRRPADRAALAFFALAVLADIAFDRPGYPSLFSALYAVPVGVLLVDGLGSAGIAPGHNRHPALATALVLVLLAAQLVAAFDPGAIADVVRTGRFPPYLYEDLGRALQSRIDRDEVVVSTEMLIWGLPDYPHLVSTASEYTASQRWDVPPEQVWERVAPDAIVIVEQETVVNAGLRAYMDRHRFEVCERFDVASLHAELLRAPCPAR